MAKKNILWRMAVLAVLLGVALGGCENADSLKEKGDRSLDAGDFEQAIGFYAKAIEKEPSPQLYISRSEAYRKQENTPAALEDLNAAITLDSGQIDAYNARAGIYYVLEDYDSARSDYHQVLSIDPENQEAKERTSAIDEIEDTAAAAALNNTTWTAFPVINGVSMENYNNGFMSLTLHFAGTTYKMVTELGGYYYGPSAYGLVNGQKMVFSSDTQEGSFAVKRSKLLMDGEELAELTGGIIRLADEGILAEFKPER